MRSASDSIRELTISLDPALFNFIAAEIATTPSVSESDYLLSLLIRERQSRMKELMLRKQFAHELGDPYSRDML